MLVGEAVEPGGALNRRVVGNHAADSEGIVFFEHILVEFVDGVIVAERAIAARVRPFPVANANSCRSAESGVVWSVAITQSNGRLLPGHNPRRQEPGDGSKVATTCPALFGFCF